MNHLCLSRTWNYSLFLIFTIIRFGLVRNERNTPYYIFRGFSLIAREKLHSKFFAIKSIIIKVKNPIKSFKKYDANRRDI